MLNYSTFFIKLVTNLLQCINIMLLQNNTCCKTITLNQNLLHKKLYFFQAAAPLLTPKTCYDILISK